MILNTINKTTQWMGKQKYGRAVIIALPLIFWPVIFGLLLLGETRPLLQRAIIATAQTAWFALIYFAHRQLPDGGLFGKEGKTAATPAIAIFIIAGFLLLFLGMPLGESYAQ